MLIHSFIVTEDEFKVIGGYQNQGKYCAQEKLNSFQYLEREYHYLPKVLNQVIICFSFHNQNNLFLSSCQLLLRHKSNASSA